MINNDPLAPHYVGNIHIEGSDNLNVVENKINIKVGSKGFLATLDNHPTSDAFMTKLPYDH